MAYHMTKIAGIVVSDDRSALEDFFASEWMDIAREAKRARGLFSVALSGGKTPAPFFRALAEASLVEASLVEAGDGQLWRSTHLFMVDERIVPHEDDASNWKMMNETLFGFGRGPIPAGNIHPVPTGCRPEACARLYEKDIRAFFKNKTGLEGGPPVLDLVHLGLGSDGHTASLFPGAPALKEKKHLAVAVPGGAMHDRVTLTYPVINNARNIIFLVMGGDKAGALARVAEKDPSLPASAVSPRKGRLLILADRQAASGLAPGSYELLKRR